MALKKQIHQFDWTGGPVTDVDDRKITKDELTSLVNTRRTVKGRLSKRKGYDKSTVSTFNGSAYQGPATEMIPSDSIIWRDTYDQIWNKNATNGQGYYRGKDQRAFPTYRGIQNILDRSAKTPLVVLNGNDLWYFVSGDIGGVPCYTVTVVDAATGATKFETAKVSATFDTMSVLAAVKDGSGNVWVIGAISTLIIAHKFVTASATPVATTVATLTAGLDIMSLDCLLLSSTGKLAVAATVLDLTGGGVKTVGHHVCYLDTATGLAEAGGVTSTYTTPTTYDSASSGMSIFGTGAASVFYLSYWRTNPSADDSVQVVLQAIATATLIATTTVLDTVTVTAADHVGVTGGYLASNGDRVVYASGIPLTPAPFITDANVQNIITTRYTFDGAATTEVVVARSAYLASRPFAVGTNYFIVTGFDDATGVQRGYYVRNADGVIVGSAFEGSGVPVFHAAAVDIGTTAYYWYTSHLVTPVSLSATTVALPLLREIFTAFAASPFLVTLDFAATYSSKTLGIVPSGVPKRVSSSDVVTELAPLHFPYQAITFTNGGGAVISTNWISYLYATIDSEGNVTRSSPRVAQQFTFNDPTPDFTLSIPTLRHAIGPTWIEVYGSINGGTDMFLQQTVKNSPSVDTVSMVIYPVQWGANGEILYTTGGALENASVPPSRLSCFWRDRTWLAGTPEDEIWFSQEHRQGRGAEFNEVLVLKWLDGTGPIQAICPMAWDALVVFKQDAIGLISGAGPDGLGIGGYIVQTISSKKGTTNPKAVVQVPAGTVFQNAADGRMNIVSGGQVVEIAQGAEAFTGLTFTAAVDSPEDRVVRFYASTGSVLVLDYGHPLQGQPAGEWSLHSNSNLVAAVGACLISGDPIMLEAGAAGTASTWTPGAGFTDNGTAVLKSWAGGRMSPAGLQGEWDLDTVYVSSTVAGGNSAYTYTLTPDVGSAEVHTDVANATADVSFRSALFRTREAKLAVAETSATGEGRVFDGCTLEVRPYGRPQNARRKIA